MSNIVPDWFKKVSVYQINPRTFSAEGTIKAVTAQLPVLAELGFGIMYLCPIFEEDDSADQANWSDRQRASKTENPKNPYRMNNYFEIDSEYGSMDDLREFVAEAHRLGLKVLLDLVYFHMGPNAPILKAHPEFALRDENGEIVMGKWHFPVLNYACEGLREYLWCNMTYYVGEIGVDGFRCDVGDRVPLDFWCEGKRRIRAIDPESVMINEGAKAEAFAAFDANYGFYWHQCLYALLVGEMTAAAFVEKYTEYGQWYPEGALVLRDLDNHDTVTDFPYRIEEHFGHDCMELVSVMNYVIDGIPMVYCGNELADEARVSMFANRFHMGQYEVTDRNAVGDAVERRKDIMKKLNRFKAESAVLRDGKTMWHGTDSDFVLMFDRILDSESITFVGNCCDKEFETDFDGTGEILFSNNAHFDNGKLKLSAYGYAVIRK